MKSCGPSERESPQKLPDAEMYNYQGTEWKHRQSRLLSHANCTVEARLVYNEVMRRYPACHACHTRLAADSNLGPEEASQRMSHNAALLLKYSQETTAELLPDVWSWE
jgi:hypothetical protein